VKRFWRGFSLTATWIVLVALTLWAIGAFYFVFPVSAFRKPAAIIYLLAVLAIVAFVREPGAKPALLEPVSSLCSGGG
jgi:hypothetical protein